jgi:transcriptional regulator with XRE-family HTH domain
MRYEVVCQQLIRALRGKRSQPAFSRHLGYRCNVLYTWESGRRSPTAATFLRLAQRAKVDVEGALKRFLGNDAEWLSSQVATKETAAALLDRLRGTTPVSELARRMQVNRVSVSRWLNAKAEPRLPEFLLAIEAASGRVLDFIALFTPPQLLPECARAWQVLEAQREVAYGMPWSHAVMRLLETQGYQALTLHEDAWVAERLGLPLETVAKCLHALGLSGSIVKRKRRWSVVNVLTVDTRARPEAGTELKRHWAEVALKRLVHLEPQKNDLFSYNLFTVSESDWERIRDLHIAYYQELRAIVAGSQPAQRVVLVNVQMMRLDEPLLPSPAVERV